MINWTSNEYKTEAFTLVLSVNIHLLVRDMDPYSTE